MILAIETATPRGSLALVSEDASPREIVLPEGIQASATLLPALAGLLREAGRGAYGITHVAVSAGPGSFTGLRVGMACAKGFCFARGVPIVPVPTLHALAAGLRAEKVALCPVLDARKKEVYAAVFRNEGGRCLRLSPDMAIAPAALPGNLPEGKVLFCGDGAAAYAALFRKLLGDRALFLPAGEGLPGAAAVGKLAISLLEDGAAADPGPLVPFSVRSPEAEVRRGGIPMSPEPP